MKRLGVSEYFYSLQGEGESMGRPSIFLRLSGCNLMCGGHGTEHDKQLYDGATWRCDTIEVWQKGKQYTPAELLSTLDSEIDFSNMINKGARLIITGGEPLLQQYAIVDFLIHLETQGILPFVEIETNGTILPCASLDHKVSQYNVSFKLNNSGMPLYKRANIPALAFHSRCPRSFFKIVLNKQEEVDEFFNMFTELNVYMPPKIRIYIMPPCSNIAQLLIENKKVAELAINNQLNFSSRLQIEIWNQTTGV